MRPMFAAAKRGSLPSRGLGFYEFLRLAGEHGLAHAKQVAGDARLLCRNGLFDRDWYASTYPDVPVRRGLSHFLERGWRDGHSPGPGFDSGFYLQANPDVAAAAINPALHFEMYGRNEGRSPLPAPVAPAPPQDVWAPDRLRAALAPFHIDADAALTAIARSEKGLSWPVIAPGAEVAVFVHSAGNIFMNEIAELLTGALNAAGYAARLCDERTALHVDGGGETCEATTRFVVAPHEFFCIARNGATVPCDWADGASLVNVEQLHTKWFRQGLEALKSARAVLDINLQSAAVLTQFGLPTRFLALGYVPDFSSFAARGRLPELPALATLERSIKDYCPAPDCRLKERPIDILFIGFLSPRRAEIFARMAERLTRWRCHFVLLDGDSPQIRGQSAALDTDAAIGLAQRSKIVLNLHQTDEPYFEWHRIVLQGLWQRALVITEPVAAQTFFAAGEHYLAAPCDELVDLIDWILGTAQGMRVAERVRNEAYRRLTQEVRLDKILFEMMSPRASPAPLNAEFES